MYIHIICRKQDCVIAVGWEGAEVQLNLWQNAVRFSSVESETKLLQTISFSFDTSVHFTANTLYFTLNATLYVVMEYFYLLLLSLQRRTRTPAGRKRRLRMVKVTQQLNGQRKQPYTHNEGPGGSKDKDNWVWVLLGQKVKFWHDKMFTLPFN